MLARVKIPLTFALVIPAEGLKPYSYDEGGFRITVRSPARNPAIRLPKEPGAVSIRGVPALVANTLVIDFLKDNFDRRKVAAAYEPSDQSIITAYNLVISKIRRVCKAYFAHPAAERVPYEIDYLNDDGSELEPHEDYIRGRAEIRLDAQWATIVPDGWSALQQLTDVDLVPWENLLLDARDQLPDVGAAVVLGATSVEVFIAHVLQVLAKKHADSMPAQFADLWDWASERPGQQFDKQPSVDEQLDVVLKVLSGHSLKEREDLWGVLKHLRTARNKFVHEGQPMVGDSVVTHQRAVQMLDAVRATFDLIRSWLPEELRWKVFA